MTADIPARIGPYSVVELLSREGSSQLFKATDPSNGRAVGVRLLSPNLIQNAAAAERFEHDSRALASSPHPNVAHLLATGTEGARPYLVTELVPGAALDQVLRERRLSISEILTVMKGICRGLAHAHERGVLHHHLSPHSILVSPNLSQVKISGFAFTRAESLGLTGTLNTGALSLGAFNYLAPEQVDSESGKPDHRTDVYAAGAVLQEMLTGRPPGGRVVLPSQTNTELPPETDVIVLKCLARKPSERYATTLDLLADLDRLEENLRVRLLSDLRGITRQGGGSRRGLILAAVFLLLVALAVAGFLLAR